MCFSFPDQSLLYYRSYRKMVTAYSLVLHADVESVESVPSSSLHCSAVNIHNTNTPETEKR